MTNQLDHMPNHIEKCSSYEETLSIGWEGYCGTCGWRKDLHLTHPGEVTEKLRRQVRTSPTDFANDLADQHFAEALDNLMEVARDTMFQVIYDDLDINLPNAKFETLLDAYQARISAWLKITPTELTNTKDD